MRKKEIVKSPKERLKCSNKEGLKLSKIKMVIAVVGMMILVSGCADALHGEMMHKDIKGKGWMQGTGFIGTYKADRRASFHMPNGAVNAAFCAEPPPDIATEQTINLGLSFAKTNKFNANAAVRVINTIKEIGVVTEQNKLSRDTLYRLCELSVNRRDIPPADMLALYKEVINKQEYSAQLRTTSGPILSLTELIRQANVAGMNLSGSDLDSLIKAH